MLKTKLEFWRGYNAIDRGHVSIGVKMDDNRPRLEATANVTYHVSWCYEKGLVEENWESTRFGGCTTHVTDL